jgi:hypothetical protein
MARSIEIEKQKVRAELKPFDEFLKELTSDAFKADYFESFRQIVVIIHEAFRSTIEQRLAAFTTGPPLAETSIELDDLKSMIGAVYNLLYITIFKNMTGVPRELYYFTDTFLEDCSISANYVLCLGEQIQVTDFRWFLLSHQFDIKYPEFWSLVKDHRFYFVQFVRKLADPNRSLDWPLLIHEIAHIVDMSKGIVAHTVSDLDYYRAYQVLRHKDLYSDERYALARKVSRVGEYLADYLATRYLAGAFPWRFVREYLTIARIFEEPRTHPDFDKRVEEMIALIKDELDLPEISKAIEEEFLVWLKDSGKTREVPHQREYAELDQVFKSAGGSMRFSATKEALKAALKRKLHGTLGDKLEQDLPSVLVALQKDFMRGRPIIVHPAVTFLIYMYGLRGANGGNGREESLAAIAKEFKLTLVQFEELMQELLADCVKLNAVYERYSKNS